MKEVHAGDVVRHFKGGIYEVIGIGNSVDDLSEQVVYHDYKGNIWIRKKEEFCGTVTRDGKTFDRLTLVKSAGESVEDLVSPN